MVWREGVKSGAIGAVVSALWFLIIDTLDGRPLYTPATLGAEVIQAGFADGAGSGRVLLLAATYTALHMLIFGLAGALVAGFIAIFERSPAWIVPGIPILVFVLGFGYHLLVITLLEPALAGLRPWTVLVANFLAAASMGIYLWRRHPRLREIRTIRL